MSSQGVMELDLAEVSSDATETTEAIDMECVRKNIEEMALMISSWQSILDLRSKYAAPIVESIGDIELKLAILMSSAVGVQAPCDDFMATYGAVLAAYEELSVVVKQLRHAQGDDVN